MSALVLKNGKQKTSRLAPNFKNGSCFITFCFKSPVPTRLFCSYLHISRRIHARRAWKGIRRIFDNPSPRQPLMPFFHGKMFTIASTGAWRLALLLLFMPPS